VADDPLVPLLDLPDVAPAFDAARAAVDGAMRHPALRRLGGEVAGEVALRSAVASAALDGHGYEREAVRDGLVTDPVVHGALRASGALDGLSVTWSQAPRQVLAKLHTLIARDVLPASSLGRPAGSSLGRPAGSSLGRGVAVDVGPRLDALVALLAGGSTAPAMVRAAVVHGELLALNAFDGPNGVLARAAARLTLIAGGLDPRGLLAVDVGHAAREPEYVGAAGAFATGTPDGVRSWLRHYAAAVELAAAELVDICEKTSR
jgi:hypothetical protein